MCTWYAVNHGAESIWCSFSYSTSICLHFAYRSQFARGISFRIVPTRSFAVCRNLSQEQGVTYSKMPGICYSGTKFTECVGGRSRGEREMMIKFQDLVTLGHLGLFCCAITWERQERYTNRDEQRFGCYVFFWRCVVREEVIARR